MSRRGPRRLLGHAVSLVAIVASTLTGFVALAPSASAATPTCNFATAGTGTYASTLCWFDLSSYNAALATGAGGQQMTMTIPGGYSISFTLKVTGGAVKAAALPTYTQAFLGNSGYTGVAGEPALYQTANATTTTATLSGISLTSSAGTTLTGYSLVGADAESSDSGESITWTSTTALASLETLGNACGGGFTGAGSTTVTCTGKSVGNKTGDAILASEAPSTFSQTMVGGGLQGIGFGVLISQLEFNKTVVNGLGSDAFKISVADGSGTVLDTANTNGTASASTGVIPVLAGTDGEKYTLSESATVGTLANYTQSWSCTRNGGADATLPTGAAGTTAKVTLNIGDSVICTITNTALSTTLGLVKHAGTPVDVNHDGLVDTGDTIPYTFTVTNNGAIAITNISVTDAKVGAVTCPLNSLAVGASQTCTANAPYTVTAADVTAGAVTNTATATASVSGTTAITTSPPSSTTTPTTAPAPSLKLTKSVSPATVTTAGQIATYSFVIKNTGNVTITNAGVTESAFTGSGTLSAITCPAGAASMAPNASVTCTATYPVSQADLNAGSVSNTASAAGKSPAGATITSASSTAKITVTQNPALTLNKSVSPTSAMTAGQVLTYSFVITNTGNLTLTSAAVNEGTFTGSGTLSAATCPAGAAAMAPGAQITCTATYTVTQADIDAATITNTATATATPPAGVTGPTVSPPSSVTMPEPANPAMTIKKTVTPTTVTTAGQTLSYSFLITNTGNVTIHTVAVAETAFTGSGTPSAVTCPAGAASLAPGAQVTCTGTYVVTQADMDAGSVSNTADATGRSPSGGTVTSPGSTALATVVANPALAVDKTASPTSVSAAGQTITYSFLITNTGNQTLHGVTAVETLFSGTGTMSALSCPAGAASLAPVAQVTCTATYVVTQADVDAGSVSNTAAATGKSPSAATITSATSNATVTVTNAPALTVTKSVLPTLVSAAGQTVTYSFLVKNTGNLTMHAVSINEGAFTGSGTVSAVSCPAGNIAPNATTTCTATYVVTQADMDTGSVSNTATASAKSPAGATTTSAPSTVSFTATNAPALTVTKSVLPTSVSTLGQSATFSFLVKNTGNVTMHGITINEGAFTGTGTLSAVSCPAGAASLAPAATVTCTATYAITQADLDAGSVSNTATASGLNPAGATTTSAPSTVSLTTTALPALTVTKSVLPTSVSAAGQTVTYSFLVRNTGNVTMTAIGITEGAFSGTGTMSALSCPAGAASLAPNASVTCTATYAVTQADMDAGSVTNTATAHGKDPAGATTTSSGSTATLSVTAHPVLDLVKSAAPIGPTNLSVGEVITYSYLVTNAGNVTLSNGAIDEGEFTGHGTLSAVSCPAGMTSIAPTASFTCTATYTVTQADVDAGTIANTATAVASPPAGVTGPTISAPSTVTMPATDEPSLTLHKSVSPSSVTAAGQTVTYSFLLINTGNVTVAGATINEGAFGGSGTLSAINCPAGISSMAPGAEVTCTATYAVTQPDVDAGSISNSATASGTDPLGATVTAPTSTATLTATASPSLTLTKTASPTTVTAATQTVTYSYLIRNTGNVTLGEPTVNETGFSGTGTLSALSCPPAAASIAPNAAVTCTATYVVTQDDMDAGTLTNTATVTASPPSGPAITSAPSSVTVAATASPALTVAKSVAPTSVSAAGQGVTYSFLITNTGNVTMHGVSVAEVAFSGTGTLGTLGCPGAMSMAPAAQVTCTAPYTVTQADIDAGTVTNTAHATGTSPAGATITSPNSSATLAVTATPALTVTKSVLPTAVSAAGQSVTYSFAVKNTGNQTLHAISVTEGAFSGTGTLSAATCPPGSLAPNATATCTATYTVTQADLDAGSVTNTATASALDPAGTSHTSAPSTATLAVTANPRLTVAKSASPSAISAVGQTVTYSFLLRNTGNQTMTAATVNEGAFSGSGSLSAISCPAGAASIAPTATVTCTATYVVTQADLDAGTLTNTATVSAKDPTGSNHTSPPSSATVTTTPGAALTINKTASPSTVDTVGQVVTYSFLITNTGNLTLTGATVDEGAFSGSGLLSAVSCPAGAASMAPNATVTCTATYSITQADLDAGSVTNSATVDAAPPAGFVGPIVSAPSSTTVTATAGPALTVSKSVAPTSVSAAGQGVTYSFLVHNTGNQTIHSVTVNEGAFSGTGSLSAATCPAGAASMAPAATVTCTATYTVTQADIDAGLVTNTATVSGKNPANVSVTSTPSSAMFAVGAAPALTVSKSVLPTSVSASGQGVTYSFAVRNTGNVTLHSVTVNEGAFSGTGTPSAVSCPAGAASLAPNATVTCTATYTVTQADIDAGSVSNTATASGTDPSGTTLTSAPSTVTLAAPAAPALTVTKSVLPNAVSAVGQGVTYSFAVRNTGNVTLHAITVNEGVFSGTGTLSAATCPGGQLAPGASATCTATYTVTQADIDAGTLTNTATVSGTDPASVVATSAPSTATVTAAASPSLTVSKTASPTTVVGAGQLVSYSFLVTNTGNVTLHAITVNEGAFSGTGTLSAATCPGGSLAPSASATCTATYTVTQADIDAGSISNTATVSAKDPANATSTSVPSTAVVTTLEGPALTLDKTASPTSVSTAGQTITYSFLITNTGNATLTGATIDEGNFTGSGLLSAVSCPAGSASMAPNATVTCTATYTVSQADIDAGSIANTATAVATPPSDLVGPIVSPPSTSAVSVDANPALTVVKSVSPTSVSAAGQGVTYSFLVTNTGNVTMHGISVNEGPFSGTGTLSSATCPPGSLAPSASVTCTATYIVTQADLDAGSVSNTATVTGLDPTGAPETSSPSTATLSAPAAPALRIQKTASPTAVDSVGQTVTYSFLVTNSGNVTMHAVTVNEGAFSGSGTLSTASCPAGSLAPSASVTCTATYDVTQADLDAGSVTNTATASATDPTGTTLASAPSTATVSVTAEPGLSLVKSAGPIGPATLTPGEVITYSFLVTNTGNLTITDVGIDEGAFNGSGLLSAVSCPPAAATLAPGASVTCTATYPVTQSDVDHGTVVNTATATGTPPSWAPGPVVSPPSTVTMPQPALPALTLDQSVSPTIVHHAGQQVTYSFVMTNGGNVTLTAATIDESTFTGTGSISPVDCPAGASSMAPQAQVTCTATYQATQADINAGQVSNIATAAAVPPGGTRHSVVSPPSTAVFTATAPPAIRIVKTASPMTISRRGQTITYSFRVTNTGNVTLRGVRVDEGAFSGSGTLSAVRCPAAAGALAPGASVTCTASYVVTQADIDAGSLSNTATASALDPAGNPLTSPPSTAKLRSTAISKLGLVKSAHAVDVDHDGVIDKGDRIDWSLVASNRGGTTITDLTVVDPSAGTVNCPRTTLAPGASMSCSVAPHTVTAADVLAGHVRNVATATGTVMGTVQITSAAARAAAVVRPTPGAVIVPPLPFTGFGATIALTKDGVLALALGGLLLAVSMPRRRRLLPALDSAPTRGPAWVWRRLGLARRLVTRRNLPAGWRLAARE
ncbi:MAG TPA: hypothetical protein VHV79_03645 [Mycobacteriales bacterium]|nr:hypothetical protein [Mycobacteriales bacterium]